MASVSLSPSSTPFDPFQSSASPRTHARKHSRVAHAAPLPVFSFNPGAQDQTQAADKVIPVPQQDEEKDMERPSSSSRTFRPSALPDFKFNPGAELPSEPTTSIPSHPILEEMVQNQKRVTRSARPAPLPAFTFSPNTQTAESSPSPTKQSFDDLHSAKSATGHRRGGSEFIGAGAEGPQVVSVSPRKTDSRPLGPPTGNPRGHMHRRSQAISVTDIDTSELIKANAIAKARAGSMPATPSDIHQPTFERLTGRSSPKHLSMSYMTGSPPSSPRRRGSLPNGRPRVGFSDHVDFIPRPLSLISSETETSTSTIRGNHSLSGSIASIASPTPRLSVNMSPPILDDSLPKRPQTAEPSDTLHNTTARPGQTLTILDLPKRPLSAAGSPSVNSTGSPPTKKKHFWFHSNEPSPVTTPLTEQGDPFTDVVVVPAWVEPVLPKKQTGPKRTNSAKKHKYHTWTAGIFSRKRAGKRMMKRVPTPPKLNRQDSDELNEIFDADDTIVIRDESPAAEKEGNPLSIHIPASVPDSDLIDDSTITSPVLDLDAALGPFGSEERLGAEHFSRNAGSRMAKLHSTERRGPVDAFGNVHRRTESAPSMPAINRSALFGVHHFGSKTSLAGDVFDEEEEDMFLADEKRATSNTSQSSLSQDLEPAETGLPSDEVAAFPITPEPKPMEGLGLSIANGASDNVVIVDEDDVANDVRSSKSTIEAPILGEADIPKRPASSPMSLAYPAPRSTYESSTDGRTTSASMVSSPDVEHNWDITPKAGRFLGNPSSDFIIRASNDDLPSLTDSMSTSAKPRMSSSGNTRSSVEQRSQSVFVPRVSRPVTSKRNSMASLSRLLTGANGSKNKLDSASNLATDEKTRKKTNRISKLMHFWRSKEKVSDS